MSINKVICLLNILYYTERISRRYYRIRKVSITGGSLLWHVVRTKFYENLSVPKLVGGTNMETHISQAHFS
jgi:hypothetical protein